MGRPETERAAIAAEGPGIGETGIKVLSAKVYQPITGVRHQRRPGIADQGNLLPLAEAVQQGRGLSRFIVFVVAHGGSPDAEAGQQLPGMPGVFTGDQIDGSENVASTRAQIPQVAQWRGQDMKSPRLGVPL